ncbi:MAG: hypothetical protein JST85_13495 [Acidobacteria bacterium]|nr:hypothetical protein [Acidobacteriota bacterium]
MEKTDASNAKILQRFYGLFFLALTLFYLALTPGTIEGQGYNRENLIAVNQIATNLFNVATGKSPNAVAWTRHGFIEPFLELPLAVVSRALFGDSVKWAGRLLIFQPILATSLLCTLLLIWAHRLTGNLRLATVLAGGAALGTMLWPYVYIGLETTQSLALMVAAYLAMGREAKGSWPETLLFGLSCAVAVAVKLNGVFLVPAIAFLIFAYLGRTGWQRPKLFGIAAILVLLYALNHLAKASYWKGADAGVSYYKDILVGSPLTAVLQACAYFGSSNKSLFLFCPVLILSFPTLGKAWKSHPRIVMFTVLTLGGLIGGFSITRMWADETWGPRYLHATIAPLMLCLAAAKSAIRIEWKREILTVVFLVAGFAVSLLGSFFSYDALHLAAIKTSQATLDTLQYDPRWNHVQFNWELMKVWGKGQFGDSQPKLWPSPRHWWFEKPEDAPPDKIVDLREFADPQPLLAQQWRPSMLVTPRVFLWLRGISAICLIAGILGFGLTWRQASSFDRNNRTSPT